MSPKLSLRILACASVTFLVGCPNREFVPPEPTNNGETNNGTQTNNGVMEGGNIGDPCDEQNVCSTGLVCDPETSTCQAPGDLAEGSPCVRTAECADGLYCDQIASVCAAGGEAVLGGSCGLTSECQAGLVCAPSGFSGQCVQPGEKDLGEECNGFTDCIAGLGCAPPLMDPTGAPVCQAGLAGLPRPWDGADCAEDEMGNFRSFFEVPDGEPMEFYRLPYPNDIRLKNGHPDLSAHPTPGAELLGFDVTQRYIDAIGDSQDRFGLNSWVFLRFSERVNFDTIKAGGDNPAVYAVIIDPDHPGYGNRVGLKWKANTGRGRYICQNWMAVRPGRDWGTPLDPDTTYAVLLSTDIKSDGGVAARQDEDFAAVLGDTRPDGALGAAWDAYQPLRDWIAAEAVDASTIANAAVFTTGNPIAEAEALAAPARATVPAASELTVCENDTVSPCDDGLEGDEHVRGCFGPGSGYAEIHGKLSLPIFQEGDAPYKESGGRVTPSEKRREDVCFAMTVPDDTMPAEGWPVLVYAHGTGGSFRSHIDNGALANYATIDIDGQTVKFLTIGWDQVQHGARRNGDETGPNELVFNYANPQAAKGNFLQGAADVHAVMAYIEQLNIAAADSPTGQEIRANPTQIYFFGHSQGGTSGPLALPWDPTSRGAVLSGAGAGLTLAILGKTTPVNSPEAVKFVLMENETPGETHPVINIIQGFFDPVDPVNFGHLIGAEVVDGVTFPKHVFHTNSQTDTYSPPAGLDAMARSLHATYILPMHVSIAGVPTADAPFGGNVQHDMSIYSILGRQYETDGTYDGHFVTFRHPTTIGDVQEFLGTAVTLGIPEVR